MLKKDKPAELNKIKNEMSAYSVICVLNMHKLPAKALQKMREVLRGKAVIKMSKKVLLKKSLEDLKMNAVKDKVDSINDKELALLLTNESPFKIFGLLKRNRTSAPAREGDITDREIIIPKGPTTLPPGPAISTLQKVSLKTSVQQGKIFVMQDKIVAKPGEKITGDMVNALNLLKIEPMEIGLEIIFAWDGILYEKGVLDVDVEEYKNRIMLAVQEAINLAVNSGYPTKDTIEIMMHKAFTEARELCLQAGIIDKEFIEDVLLKAIREASLLQAKSN